MTRVERDGEGFVVDASLVAEILGLDVARVREGMQTGAITTMCEAGQGEDAGRWRLTFLHDGAACRLVIDAGGTVLRRSSFPVRTREAQQAGAEPAPRPGKAGDASG